MRFQPPIPTGVVNGPPGPGIRQCCPPWGRDGAANGWGYPSPRRPPAGIGPPGGRDVRMDWGLLPTRSVARCAAGCPGRARKSAPAAHRRDFRRVVAPRWSSPVCLCRQSPSGGLSGSSGQGGRRSHFPASPAQALPQPPGSLIVPTVVVILGATWWLPCLPRARRAARHMQLRRANRGPTT